VISQPKHERNFHIFYQLLLGLPDEMLQELELERDMRKYHYLSNGLEIDDSNETGESFSSIDDKGDFEMMFKALKTCDFSDDDRSVNFFKPFFQKYFKSNSEIKSKSQKIIYFRIY
jgi:myosin heavy subunit